MTLTIDLKPELEARLREEAAQTGIETGAFVVRALEERLQPKGAARDPSHLSRSESELLQRINQGLPEQTWSEYHVLIDRRRAETLTPQEHLRLIALGDTIEAVHATRMADLAQLARLQDIPLKDLAERLGIKPRRV